MLVRWRHLQNIHMNPFLAPGILDLDEIFDPNSVTIQTIGLPSDLLPLPECDSEDFHTLITAETSLRQAEAEEALDSLRRVVRMLGALEHEKRVHRRGQEQNTRTNSQLEDLRRRRDTFIDTYNCARDALEKLGVIQKEDDKGCYPKLSVSDTFRRNPESRRELGDSRRPESQLWRPLAIPAALSLSPAAANTALASALAGESVSHQDGWIWGSRKQPSEVDEPDWRSWELEGDRVQWFRAEAEFFRWLEHMEIKHFEFVRLLTSLQHLVFSWRHLSTEFTGNPYLRSYALRKSTSYEILRESAKKLFLKHGHASLMVDPEDVPSHSALIQRCLSLRTSLLDQIGPNYASLLDSQST